MDPTSQTSSGALATMSIRFCAERSQPTEPGDNLAQEFESLAGRIGPLE